MNKYTIERTEKETRETIGNPKTKNKKVNLKKIYK